ncbi:hypothetical protein BKE38_06630 [Pseudoroseomonas deserti]|uniref:DUF4440 domain-containing protein n=1 Tax=Teichococcus deserti TaxID=1817963 RepID=A0A1V2H5E0_9PROT|nr:hypothetical protein [Pseudoroseomonas deserti]ONG56177.1 hypothetical protein BKE38_06630 [Pseudoroseomonas deserti]
MAPVIGASMRAPLLAALLLACPLLASGCAAQAPAPAPRAAAAASTSGIPSALQTQWQAFRAAVLAGDNAALASMTRFPLEVAGTLDDSGVQRIGQDRFAATLAKVLGHDSGLSPRQPQTNRDLVQRTESLAQDPRRPTATDDQARVGALVFSRIGSQWKLTRVYLEDE